MLATEDVSLLPSSRAWPLRRLWYWCGSAWRLFRHVPVRWAGLALLPMLVEVILQLSIPLVGVALSKLLVPVVSMGCLLMLDQRVRDGCFDPARGMRRLRAMRGRVLQLALLSAGVFVFQLSVVCLWLDPQAALGMATGDMAVVARFNRLQMAGVLASGMLPALLLFFTTPHMVLGNAPFCIALRDNLRWLHKGWRPLSGYMAVLTGLVAGSVFQPWLLLPLLMLGPVGYWAYRDAIDPRPAD